MSVIFTFVITEEMDSGQSGKGQLISKAIYSLLTSPKKQTDEFVFFAFLLFTANKTNSPVCFLGEFRAHAPIWFLVLSNH